MVLLLTAAAFAALSLVSFVVGLALDRPELAMIGAIIMVGVGGTGVVQGYQVQTGEDTQVETIESTEPDLDLSNVSLVTTKDVSSTTPSPRGLDWSIDGNHLYSVSSTGDYVTQYDAGNFDLALATYNRSLDVSNEVSVGVGVEIERDGREMYVTNNGADNQVVHYTMSEPYNVSSATVTSIFDTDPYADQPRLTDFNSDGTKMFLVDSENASIESFTITDPYNLSTASHLRSFDIASQEMTPNAMAFERQGMSLLIVGESSDEVYAYKLDEEYDLATAMYTGHSLDLRDLYGIDRPSAISYTEDGASFFVADYQASEMYQFEAEETKTIQSRERRAVYQDVGAISSFPLEVIVLLLGIVMLMTGTGKASEK